MKKRILSIVITLCMVFSFMPQVVFANSNEDSLPEGDLSWENDVLIGGTPVTRSQLAGNGWLFDPDTYTLTLRDGFTSSNTANLQDSTENAAVIYVKSDHDLTIEIEGDVTIGADGWQNALTSNKKRLYGIYALSSCVTITGSHSLNVYGSETALWCKNLTVDGTKLSCRSYYTAVKVCSDAYSYLKKNYSGEEDMTVKNGANVFARTTHGLGIRPNDRLAGWFHFNDYGGGAGIFVNGSLRVENSTVDSENTCFELPPPVSDTSDCQKNIFCTSICVLVDLVVSGSTARVTGKLRNEADNFGTDDGASKLGAVMAKNLRVRDGGTIEGFITNEYLSQYAQGLRQLGWFDEHRTTLSINPANICLDGEGTVRNGIKRDASVVNLGTEEFQYTGSICSYTENTEATSEYNCYREVKVEMTGPPKAYLRTTDEGGLQWSFDENFSQPYSIDSSTIDLRDFSNTAFVKNGWQVEWGFSKFYVKSGNWTIIPPCETEVDCYIESGSLTIQPQDGMEYAGGKAHIAEGAVMSVDGNGIAKNWDVYVYNSEDELGGTLRFVSGTVENASADNGVSVNILGGNINFNPESIMQVVKNGNGLQIYKDVYLMQPCEDELIEINTGEGTITPESSYYYPIGDNRALVVWTVNDLPIKYVTVAPEGGESYNLISGGSVEGLGSGYHKLVTAERYREFVPNPNYKFFRNPDESVTMNAAGSIDTYENRLDSAFYGPYLIGSSSNLDSSLRAEWSYQNDSGEKVVVGGNSLTCTIDDLSDIVGFRTYNCTVYEKDANGSENAIGSYNAKVYVMRWDQPDMMYATIGKEVTFTINPSEETEWAAGFLSTLKWQVNKGTDWEDIPDSNKDSYTVTITEENAGFKYRRVIYGSTIGNFNTHEAGIYVEFNSPELSLIRAPEITSQPQDLTIHEKDTTEHMLSVTALNAENYQWQKKVDDVFTDIEGQTSSTLSVSLQDVGTTYRCVVSNAYGETVSQEASIKMLFAPVMGTPTGGNAVLGGKAEFGVSFSNVSGDGSVNIKWQYSADDGDTWVDVVSTDSSDNISMFYVAIQFGIKPIGQPGASTIISSRIDGATMTINKTTADMDGWKVRCVLTDEVGVYYSSTVQLSIDMPDYTVAFDTGSGTEIDPKTTVKWTDKVLDGVSAPTKEGWEFICWKYGDVIVTPQTTYGELASDDTVMSIELKAQWQDVTGLKGEISIDTNSWTEFFNNITFGMFFKDTQTVTITASDNSGEDVTIEYLLSDKELTADELAAATFTAYTGVFNINPDNEYVIYAKLTGTSGNCIYINSNGIVLDATAPAISGVENGKTYCSAQRVTVTEKYLASVTVNGEEVTLDENNQFTLSPAEGTQTIVVTDKTGNVSAEIIVTVNDVHSYDNGFCTICGGYEPAEIISDETSQYNGYYAIENAGQLYWFAQQVNSGDYSINAVLTADITVNSNLLSSLQFDSETGEVTNGENFTSWTPVGNFSNPYTGTFDGQNHTISGLYFNDTSESYVGLFGYIAAVTDSNANTTSTGTIVYVGVVDSYFNGLSDVGGVCGMNIGGTITNCYNTGTVSGQKFVSGVCGMNDGPITNCYNTGKVRGRDNVGGVCGANGDTITNCYYLAERETDLIDGTTFKTTAQFKSGEVAYLLSQDENGSVWGQTIGTENSPVLGGKKVLANKGTSKFANDIIIYGQSATLDGMIGMNVYVAADDDYTDWTASFNGTVVAKPEKDANGLYKFTYQVAAKDMDNEIQFYINEKVNAAISVSDYLTELKNCESEGTPLANLADAMETYGNAASEFFKIDGTVPAPAEEVTAENLSGYAFEKGTAPEGISYYGSSLLLKSETTVRHYFKLADGQNIENFTFTVKVGDAEYCTVTPVEKQGYYYIDIENISADKLDEKHTVKIGDSEVISGYSALSYAKTVLDNDTADENLKNLVKTLYLYNQNALAYINAA